MGCKNCLCKNCNAPCGIKCKAHYGCLGSVKNCSEYEPKENPQMVNDFFEITSPIGSKDYFLFKSLVIQGIDSRLEGFTISEFFELGRRQVFRFHISELSILLRRLSEKARINENASQWENDILQYKYGIEVI